MNSRNDVSYTKLFKLSSKPAICSLENPKTKMVLIFSSENPCLYVSSLISRLITKKHNNQDLYKDRKKLKLKILETLPKKATRHGYDKWSLVYWYNTYSKAGWSLYSVYKPVSLNVHIKINYRYGAMVELCNAGGKGFVVGVFPTMKEAEGWVDEVYPDLDHVEPLFACNLETIMYYRSVKFS